MLRTNPLIMLDPPWFDIKYDQNALGFTSHRQLQNDFNNFKTT
jgi:hypothetical protein